MRRLICVAISLFLLGGTSYAQQRSKSSLADILRKERDVTCAKASPCAYDFNMLAIEAVIIDLDRDLAVTLLRTGFGKDAELLLDRVRLDTEKYEKKLEELRAKYKK